ncbi:MAG: TolC family protein [Acidobacteria bacterium]|nr:MAG: TolC family protein [Acidobacteriota bacterium]
MSQAPARSSRRHLPALALASAALLAGVPSPVLAQKVEVPIASADRKPSPLPEGERIELTLQQAIALALRNALDLDVASYGYEKAAFSLGSAQGIFDAALSAELTAQRNETPPVRSLQATDSRSQTGNIFVGGLLPWGTTYEAGWTNRRNDSPSVGTELIPGYIEINPTYSSSLSASIVQPLLRDFGKLVSTRLIVQSRIARDQAAWSFVSAVQTTIQTVENAYWDLLYANENLKAKTEALERAKDLNRITKIKIDVGALAPIEIVQTEVTIAQREQEIIVAEGLIGDAQDRLKRILNVKGEVEWDRPIVPADKPVMETREFDVEAGIQRALELRPEVKQAVVDIESKKVSLAYNRNQLKPRLDLSAGYGLSGVGYNKTLEGPEGGYVSRDYMDALYQIRDADYPGWNVGLSFSVPILNRTAKGNVAVAATDLELSRTNLTILKQNLQLEVRAAARAVDTAKRSVVAAKKSRELAERNLDAEKKKYENGMTTSFQVSQIQNDLTAARTGELQAILGYTRSVVAWHRAVGDLLEVKGVDLQGLPVPTGATPPEEGALR